MQAQFARRVDEGRSRFTLIAQELARTAAGILAERAALEKKLVAMKTFPRETEDVKQQIGRLLAPGWLARTPWERLQHLPRYLKAASLRLDKLRADPARDARLAAELASLEVPYRREAAARARQGAPTRGVRAVRLAAGGAARLALRAGAEDAGAGLGEAPGETLADCPAMNVAGALLYGLANLFHPRMLWLMVWPMLVALAIWGTAALFLWARLAIWLAGVLRPWIEPTLGYVRLDFGDAAMIAANVRAVPAVRAAGLPDGAIHPRHLRHAEDGRARGRALVSRTSSAGAAAAPRAACGTASWRFVGMLLLFIVSLPLWLLPPLWPLIPLAILSLGQPAAAALRRAGRARRRGGDAAPVQRAPRLRSTCWACCWRLLAYVPFVNFIGPVVFGLAFIRYLLGALESIRPDYRVHPNKELAAGNAPP